MVCIWSKSWLGLHFHSLRANQLAPVPMLQFHSFLSSSDSLRQVLARIFWLRLTMYYTHVRNAGSVMALASVRSFSLNACWLAGLIRVLRGLTPPTGYPSGYIQCLSRVYRCVCVWKHQLPACLESNIWKWIFSDILSEVGAASRETFGWRRNSCSETVPLDCFFGCLNYCFIMLWRIFFCIFQVFWDCKQLFCCHPKQTRLCLEIRGHRDRSHRCQIANIRCVLLLIIRLVASICRW